MTINYEYVQVELPYEVLHIEDLHFIAEINEHHTLTLEALINEENAEEYLEESVEGKEVKLIVGEKVIFVGKIIELQIYYRGQMANLKLKTISYSYDLDIKKHKQAFFNLQSTYEDVARNVLSKYPHKAFKDNITNGKCIRDLLVQYKETDFEFLKRLATHFETVLVVDSLASMGRIHFGVEPIYTDVELESEFKDAKIRLDNFTKIKCVSKEELIEQDFIGWQVESKEYIPLISEFTYDGQKVIVAKVEMKKVKEEIIYAYELKFYKGIKTIYQINSKLKGISLEGIVKKRRNNEMQLHFCINDSYEDIKSNKWFQYGREVSNFYVMPVLESKVHVTFLSGDEKDTIVTNAVRTAKPGDKYYSKIAEHNNKSYSTVDGQELLITPEMLQFAEDDGKSIQMMLNQNGSISITGKNISIHAGSDMVIGTAAPYDSKTNPLKPTSISISAKNKVTITRASNGINSAHSMQLQEENHISGIVRML
ncbi:hypothetical protein [Clostridium sp.]|uniref:hypothetical protein n=1 Tax=Clostridium sp. TaxID=1506 RepID=UPI002627F011|nr:hypothetical protein [Clostridium sp.]